MMRRSVLALLVTMSLAAAAGAQGMPFTDDEVDAAIDRACQYLVKLQNPDGSWPPYQGFTHANTTLAMLGLAYAEYDIKSDVMKKGLKALLAAEYKESQTYQTAFRMQALAKLYRQVDRETRELVMDRLKKDAEFLVLNQSKVGGWSYNPSPTQTGIGDFSNVQICVLGLGEAVKVGLELPKEPFVKTQLLYIKEQLPDGGWNYGRQVNDAWPWTTDQKMPSYGSMTAAGVASLYITRDYLYPGLGCPCRSGSSNYRQNKVDEAIDRALKWLGEHYRADANPKSTHFTMYWHYSCERVGLASGIKYFGGHNWYAEGGQWVLGGQGGDGGWGHRFDPPSKEYPKGNLVSVPQTAWAMLFLIKGRAPVLMNKLSFEGAWNYHPRDLANLVHYVDNIKEQPFQWQVITLEAPVDEWHDAPILYMTPESIIKLTDDEKAKLRKFTDDGGTIFFEASCGNPTVRAWWMKAASEIWPEFEFRVIDKDHSLWSADVDMRRRIPGLQEMTDGVRTFIFYAPNDVSCAWSQMQITNRTDAFQFGLNLYSYSTDRAKIRSRLAGATGRKARSADAKALRPGPRADLKFVRLTHGGDWNVTERYHLVEKLAQRLGQNDAFKLEVLKPAAASSADIPAGAVLFATGRVGIDMSEAERKALADRLRGGSFLVVDATLGDPRFDKTFRDFASLMNWRLELLKDESPVVSGSMGGASGHKLTEDLRFTYHALAQATSPLGLGLIGLYDGDRLVGVYSPKDLMYAGAGLRAWGSIGFDEVSADRIQDNLVTFATTLTAAAAQPAATPPPAPAPASAAPATD